MRPEDGLAQARVYGRRLCGRAHTATGVRQFENGIWPWQTLDFTSSRASFFQFQELSNARHRSSCGRSRE